ncbi:ribokinase [Allorhodopirellula heiligendammensis]|uniref:Ribokinase n=1 Tax=Allorhodopirellula heiligendammensis TaxID=2714739 RepID=A0A5C6C3V3_9BACT|nr:ribokinase [Allorhodopirellula heiligendammensis]TWU18765.1 Ribokinase [Allorhodopirellula heiligendammensis]|tara:strand:- start:467 stop:1402 length:936 start_codon:yes stop_codon:yes gene_type:complete
MKSARRICVVGSANIDLTFRTPRFPQPGETLTGYSQHQGMGGKGANQAVAAARLGTDVTFIACVGNDAFGKAAIDAYEAEGIQTSVMRRAEDQPTGTAAILVDDHAENCIIVVAGANGRLNAEDVKAASSMIEQSDAVLCQLETPVVAAVEAFRLARTLDVLTVLTPAPAEHVTDQLLALCDVCVPNRLEISTLTGQPVETEADALRAAELLRERGVKRVALTMGGNGVFLLDDSGSAHISAIKVEAVDTTGAGDAFTAALTVSLVDGMTLTESARWASTVAAISVTRIGTQTAFPTLKEVNEWSPLKKNA